MIDSTQFISGRTPRHAEALPVAHDLLAPEGFDTADLKEANVL